MDGDVGRWSLEFLLGNPLTDSNLIKLMIRIMPVLDADSRLKKTLLLKTLQDQLSTVSIAESTLETLELLEELLRLEGSPVTAAMSAAYCAVALECTLKYLQLKLDHNPNYLKAVQRIWHGRVRYMEPSANASEGSLLFSPELSRWRGDIEASLSDLQVRERLASIHTRRDAIHKLKTFLAEAWPIVGLSFLELAASTIVNESPHPLSGNDAAEPSSKRDRCSDATTKGASFAAREFTHQPTATPIETPKNNELYEGWCTSVIPSAEELGASTPCSKFDSVPNCEVQKVGQSGGDENPLLSALHTPDLVRSEMTMKDMNEEPPVENPSRVADVNKDDNLKERTSVLENAGHRPSMTHEGGEPIDDLQDGTSHNARRFHLPSPKRRKVSPLKKYEPAKITKRRKPKKWSQLEEETLRTAVDKFGKGNWKLILHTHRDIFEERSEVDLKDKWRNMARYGCK